MTTPEELHFYRQAGPHVDSDHPAVRALAQQTTHGFGTVREQAVALYYVVRDGFRYDPYAIQAVGRCFTASVVVETGSGFCISKAALLAATARAAGIPARVGFADVKNHLTSPRLRELMDSDEFVYHGYTELWIEGRWVKATPAFNRSLCDKAGVRPLEFDGQTDSLFHPLDQSGRKHMEYLRDHGSRPDVPVAEILASWEKFYPKMATWGQQSAAANFEQEVVSDLSAA
ncbi:transglutaminase family protein [Nevskia sp.]|uniref:transglutaminase-like domain-containing protein n=1 Tax=Nevskia sp. TaxID=1929292 RepID=UPI0025E116E9|nr:transglutaminase family protein [Nevskia sp.]